MLRNALLLIALVLMWPSDVDAGPTVYWTDFTVGKIERTNLDGTGREVLVNGLTGNPHGIALDIANDHMYWTEYGADRTGGHSIRRANLDGTNVVNLVTGLLGNPAGLALDLVHGHMYWTDADIRFSAIRRANLDGSGMTTVLSTSSPRDISLTATRMYWTDWYTGTLESANLEGSDRRVLRTDLSLPYGLEVDVTHGIIYWADSGRNRIRQANLDGSDARDVTIANNPVALALDLPSGKLYWSDQGGTRIHAVNTDGTGAVEILPIGDATYGIALRLGTPTIPFTTFGARAEVALGPGTNDDAFKVKALFTLGTGSNDINPPTEEVTLRLGTGAWTIPASAFHEDRKGRFKFEGWLGATWLEVVIRPLERGGYEVRAEGIRAALTGTVNPVTVGLTIGDDGGTTTVLAEFHPTCSR